MKNALNEYQLIVVGGGASGFMGAITAAELGTSSVLILEASARYLEKVRISGGGRCNVTNSIWNPSELVQNYPRGSVQLKSSFSKFSSGDVVSWFEERGLALKIEKDGRIFPKSNSSEDVLKCLKNQAKKFNVNTLLHKSVREIKVTAKDSFLVKCSNGDIYIAKNILLSTGSSPIGKKIAENLGHKIVSPVPSIFGFTLSSHDLKSFSGTSFEHAFIRLKCKNKVFSGEGRILITHKGLSGPAVLRLSAFAARELHNQKYNATLEVNWINKNLDEVVKVFNKYREVFPKKRIINSFPFDYLPKKFLRYLCCKNNIDNENKWANLSSKNAFTLAKSLTKDSFNMKGRSPNGDEFVTAGGISLDEINFKYMESKKIKGLYFAGEIIDIDGVTGGFNFQHCWTSAWIAGKSITSKFVSS